MEMRKCGQGNACHPSTRLAVAISSKKKDTVRMERVASSFIEDTAQKEWVAEKYCGA